MAKVEIRIIYMWHYDKKKWLFFSQKLLFLDAIASSWQWLDNQDNQDSQDDM